MFVDQQLPGTHTSSATHLISALTGFALAGSDVFPSAHHSSSSFSPGSNSGGDLYLLEKIANFWVLRLTVLSFENMACKMKDFHYSSKIPCTILYFCILRLDKALRCLELKACQKHLNYKFSVSFLPEPLKRHPLKEMPVDQFSFQDTSELF